MTPSTTQKTLTEKKGSTLLIGLILSIAVGTTVGYVMRTSTVEARLNEDHFVSLEARNTAESLVDYGVGQLVRRWDSQVSFKDDELAPYNSPLTIDAEIDSFLAQSSINTSTTALFGGTIPPNTQFYINPNDPANRFDPQKGKIVLARDIEIFGRATASHPVMGEHTAYAVQTLQLRDSPLFSHAIFYNMDLEFHPGPTMTINGPVHANGNIWAVAKAPLYFTDTVTTSQDFRVSMMKVPYQGDWSNMSGENSQNGRNVKITNGSGGYKDPYTGSGPTNKEASFYTSVTNNFSGTGYETWREFSSNRWVGNLQTKEHGIPVLNPVGYDDYVPDTTGSTTVENHGYAIIEPNLPLSSPYHKAAGELEKFARKAGLIIRVHKDADGDNVDDERGTDLSGSSYVRLRARPFPDDGWSSQAKDWFNYHNDYMDSAAYQSWVNAGYDSDGDGSEDPPPPLPDGSSFVSNLPIHPSSYETDYYLSFSTLSRTDPTEPNSELNVNSSTATVMDPDGNPVQITVSEVIEVPVPMNSNFDAQDSPTAIPAGGAAFDAYIRAESDFGTQLRGEFDEMFAAHPVIYEKDDNIDYNGDGDKNDLPSGMIDKRIEKNGSTAESRINLIELNTAAFARQVETWHGDTFQNYHMPHKYNGVVYVEFATDPAHTPRSSDKVIKSINNHGVLLSEGGGSDPVLNGVPDPSYNINAANRDRGFTLATNNAIYVLGHFNADGDFGTPSSGSYVDSDNGGAPDPPVALAGDAITILSPKWVLSNSRNTNPTADPSEVCAAIVCGLMPTNKSGASVSSGGSHNFPRFLEKWSNKTFRYRGSLVALFESEIQNQPWGGSYYSPPKRQWGFFTEFRNGNYPPGTPNVRSYRKIDFRFLNEAEFSARKAALPWQVSLP
jgi:hypothetical protein